MIGAAQLRRTFALVLCLTSIVGCATLRPHSPKPTAPTAQHTTLLAVEGTPTGLVLRLTTSVDATQLALFRALDGEEAVVLQTVDLSESLLAALRDGVDLVDATIPVGEVVYQFALLRDDAVVAQSDVVKLSWRHPPPRPGEVVVRATFGSAVELAWPPVADARAVVLRRNVLDAQDGFTRVAELPIGQAVWVDRDVAPGQVWSYQVVLAFEHDDGLLQYGAASEEVYASTPEQP